MRGVGGGPSDPGNLSMSYLVVSLLLLPTSHAVLNMGNPDAKRLYDDLLSNYNKLVRPVQNTTDPLTVRIKLKLSQLIDVVSHSPLLQHYRVYCTALHFLHQSDLLSPITRHLLLYKYKTLLSFVKTGARQVGRSAELKLIKDTCTASLPGCLSM